MADEPSAVAFAIISSLVRAGPMPATITTSGARGEAYWPPGSTTCGYAEDDAAASAMRLTAIPD